MLSEAIDTFNNKSISSLISTNYIFILWILKKKKKINKENYFYKCLKDLISF